MITADNNIKRRLQLLKNDINLLTTLKKNGYKIDNSQLIETYKQLKYCRKLVNSSISAYIGDLYKSI